MSEGFVLFYWPLGFRGNLIRCLLDFTGTLYTEGSTEELLRLKGMSPNEAEALFMAPPLLYDKELDLYLAQASAIIGHLSRKLDMRPASLRKQSIGDKIVEDCGDILNEVTRGCGAQMWDQDTWEAFISPGGRFEKWLLIFERTARREGLESDRGFFLGTESATFADTTVFGLLATLERSVPELSPLMRRHAPGVMALCDRLGSNPGLVALFQRMPERPYCGGMIEESLRKVISASTTLSA
jgi:glutathione S-transferase